MKNSNKKGILHLIIYFIFAILIAGTLLNLAWNELHMKSDRIPERLAYEDIGSGWYLGGELSGENIFFLPNTVETEGKRFMISRRLPDSGDYDHLIMWNCGQSVQAALDGEWFYNYDIRKIEVIGRDRPYMYLLIPLPDGWEGKVLTLQLESVVPADTGKVGEIFIGEKTSLIIQIVRLFQFEVIAAIVMMIISLQMVAQSTFLRISVKKKDSMLPLGVAMFVASFWVLADCRIRQFIFPNVSAIRNAAFFAVMLLPGVMTFYIDYIQGHRYRKLYSAIQVAAIIDTLVQLVLNRMGIFGLSEMSIVSHGLSVVTVVGFLVTIVIDDKQKRNTSYSTAAIGLIAFSVGTILQIVCYRFIPLPEYSGIFVVMGLIFMAVFCTVQNFKELGLVHRGKENAENVALALTDDAMVSMARTVDAKDLYTSGHSHRVASYSRELARRMNLEKEFQDRIYYIGLLHDIGKIGIPDSIINKNDKLTDDEYNKVKTHVVIGSEIVERISAIPDLYEGVRNHHERYDGKGYPDRLAGKDIPLVARIIAVADSYDAMTSNRSYRDSLPQNVVREELENGKGTQFDPEIADIMIGMIDEDVQFLLRENGAAAGVSAKPAQSVASEEEKKRNLNRFIRTITDYAETPISYKEEKGTEIAFYVTKKEDTFWDQIKRIILYAGVEEKDFREIYDTKMANLNILFVTYFALGAYLCTGFMFVLSLISQELRPNRFVYGIGAVFSLLIFILAVVLKRKWPQGIYFIIYLAVAVFFGYGILLGAVTRPDVPAVTFMVMMMFVPLLFADSPARMGFSIFLADLVFMIVAFKTKSGAVFINDFANAIVFGTLSIAIDTVMMVIKVRSFAMELQLEKQSYTDQLTGVKNRNSFEKALLDYPNREGKRLFCVYADVNGLHELNNQMGHDKGDLMLKVVAAQLREAFGENDTYRIGGDEFVAFGIDIDNMALASRLYMFTEKIRKSGYHVSIGFDSQELKNIDMKQLISAAEKRMYEEKSKYYSEVGNDRRKR